MDSTLESLEGNNPIATDWMFVFPLKPPTKIHTLKPNPQCDGIWKWGLWKVIKSWGWNLMNGISTLIKDIPENSLTCSALWGHSKKMIVIYEPESRPSPDKESPCLDLRLLSLQNWDKYIYFVCLFINQLCYGILLWQPINTLISDFWIAELRE